MTHFMLALQAVCILLLLQPVCAKREAYEIEYAGKLYGVLDKAMPNERDAKCQSAYLTLPRDAIIAPDTAAIVTNVVARYAWGTHVVVLANGNSYNTANYGTPGVRFGGSMLSTQGNTYKPNSCSLRILYERDATTTTVTATTTTVTTATTTTTTTYVPQRCHGVSEPAACGTRIPTGDCSAGGEHQTFAEDSCPAMCGLTCSSTTVTKTSTTTATATTKTTTSSTSTTTTTTQTTVTTFTTTTVLALNANCNPRDDRCDAQEGLACDIEHNECRHAEDVAIPLFLQPEVDRLIKDAVDAAGKANDRDMAALTASKDADFAALTSAKDADVAILTASKDAEIATLTAAKDTEIAALTVAVHEKELAIVTAKANLTVCSSKLEARRLVRLANAAADLEALNNGERTDSPCAGQKDPPECDLWSTDQCGTVLFGNVNVTAECAVLCENCVPTPQEAANGAAVNGSPDIDASAIASGNRTNSTLFLAVGICAGIVVLATVINIMIRRNGTNQGGDDQYSNAGAFVNPMYSEEDHGGGAAPQHVYRGNSAQQEESYEEIPVPATSNGTYNAAEEDLEGHYDGLDGNSTYAAAADDTYEDVVGGGGNYLDVEDADFSV